MSRLNKVVVGVFVVSVLTTSFSLAIEQKGGDNRDLAIEKKFTKTADADGGKDRRRTRVTQSTDAAKHGLLAQLLVLQTGLYRFLPTNPTDFQCFEILRVNGIVPEGGWRPDKIVTRGDLARVVVQALQQSDKVEDKGNPRAWLDVLSSLGFEITTIGETVEGVSIIGNPTAGSSTLMANNLSEAMTGLDVGATIQDISPPVRPNPVTPN